MNVAAADVKPHRVSDVPVEVSAEGLMPGIIRRYEHNGSSGGKQLTQIGAMVGLETTPSMALRQLVRWTVLVVAGAQATLILELEVVASVIDRVVWVGPILLVVLSVLYVGATLSERLARAVHTAAERAGPFLHLWQPPSFVWRSWLLQP